MSIQEADFHPDENISDVVSGLANNEDVLELLNEAPPAKSLKSVAAHWTESCGLKDSEENNCAHYLSDAFIRAGYADLQKSSNNKHFTEWCDWDQQKKSPEARPIRAKEMWAWFKSMATKKKTIKPKNEGFWAVFQWDKSYSGGHVLLYDSDKKKAYGTGQGAYWSWSHHYFYQW